MLDETIFDALKACAKYKIISANRDGVFSGSPLDTCKLYMKVYMVWQPLWHKTNGQTTALAEEWGTVDDEGGGRFGGENSPDDLHKFYVGLIPSTDLDDNEAHFAAFELKKNTDDLTLRRKRRALGFRACKIFFGRRKSIFVGAYWDKDFGSRGGFFNSSRSKSLAQEHLHRAVGLNSQFDNVAVRTLIVNDQYFGDTATRIPIYWESDWTRGEATYVFDIYAPGFKFFKEEVEYHESVAKVYSDDGSEYLYDVEYFPLGTLSLTELYLLAPSLGDADAFFFSELTANKAPNNPFNFAKLMAWSAKFERDPEATLAMLYPRAVGGNVIDLSGLDLSTCRTESSKLLTIDYSKPNSIVEEAVNSFSDTINI